MSTDQSLESNHSIPFTTRKGYAPRAIANPPEYMRRRGPIKKRPLTDEEFLEIENMMYKLEFKIREMMYGEHPGVTPESPVDQTSLRQEASRNIDKDVSYRNNE